ncbi:ketosteroid isomerase family protein [Leptolyngbya sp. AN03gr2]|uniref:ketosteroid isomerase family protein n=1 Tax=unclassified Leptolyngbya TaxID=2650499 RepID=UPI003D316F5E
MQTVAAIEIPHLVIVRYFETLNSGEFEETSQLFAIDGAMQPPFESQIVGRDAIAAYLRKEAQSLKLFPQRYSSKLLDNGCTEVQAIGRVETSVFSVNVQWQFILSPNQELFLAKIKLLASLEELLHLRQLN